MSLVNLGEGGGGGDGIGFSWYSTVLKSFVFQTMVEMNKVMDPQKTMKVMQEFEKESTKMGMSEEMSEFQSFLHTYF